MIVLPTSPRAVRKDTLKPYAWWMFICWVLAVGGLQAQSADLSIQVSDGLTEATPGASLTYTVQVLNQGPDDAPGVVVSDVFPNSLACIWTCIGAGGASCTPGQVSGDIADSFDMPSGSMATYTAVCEIDPSASGSLQNPAQVLSPAGITDPNPNNNTASDQDTLLVPRYDVQLSKTDGRDAARPGDTLTYVLEVSHSGPSDAVGLRVRDTLPDGLRDIAWNCQASAGSSCTASGNGDVDDLATLQRGGALQYAIEATVEADATGTLFNLATVTSPAGAVDTNPSNNGDSDATVIEVQLDLSVRVTADSDPVVPGTTQGYQLEVHNDGPADAVGAQLSVDWPQALETVVWTCSPSGGASCPATSGYGDIMTQLDLPVGASLVYGLNSLVDPAATGALELDAVLQAPAGAIDPQSANNQSQLLTPLTPQASVAVSLDADVDIAVPGRSILYDLRVSQDGPSTVSGITVSSPSDDTTSCLWTCIPSGNASCPAGPVAGDVDLTVDLHPGSALNISIDCAIDSAATADLVRMAQLDIPETVEDLSPSDNVTSHITPLQPEADLAVTKTDGLSQVAAGTSTTYTLDVSNPFGPSDARQVSVRDLFVEALDCTWTCVGQAGGLCTPGQVAGDIDDMAQLPVGSRAIYTAVCAISPDATGSLVNGVSVTAPPNLMDPNGSNNSALDTTDIEPAVDLAIQLDDGLTEAVPGTSLTYTLTVDNVSPTDADGAEVRSLWADDLTCTWGCVAGPGATCTAGQVVGDLIDEIHLPAGGQVTYTAACDLSASATGVLSQQATVEPPGGLTDLQPGNNQASDLDTQLEPHADLAILKTDGLVAVQPGGELTYTVTVSNASGPSDAVGAQVIDTLPEVVDCTWSCAVSGDATCTSTPPPGDLQDAVDLPVGSLAVYTASCTVADDAATSPVNTATVAMDANGVDPDPDNNSATDDDTLLVETIDLRLTLQTEDEAVAGSSVRYMLEVSHPLQLVLRANTPEGVQLFGLHLPSADLEAQSTLRLIPLGALNHSPFRHLGFADSVHHPLNGRLLQLITEDGSPRLQIGSGAPESVPQDLALRLPPGLEGSAIQDLAVVPDLGSSARVVNQTSPNLLCTWTCLASGGGTCTEGPVNGPLDDAVDLPVGAVLAYQLDCRLPSNADDTALHSATVSPPPSVTDSNTDDNVASIDLPVTRHADLRLTKTDGVTEASPGTSVTYTLVASNPAGPSDVTSAQLVDLFPTELDCLWSCQAEGGAACTPGQVSGNIQDTLDLPMGSRATYTAHCSIDANAQGSLSNIADLLVPTGVLELNDGDNRASDLDTVLVPTADLAVQLQAETSAIPGTSTSSTVTVDNHGPSAVLNATVESFFPEGLSCLWACSASGGGVCTPGQVSGNLIDSVDLPVGSRATYEIQCDVDSSRKGSLQLQVAVQVPIPGSDPVPDNNVAQAAIDLVPTADLQLTKDDGVDIAHPGGAVTYQLVARNALGPSDLDGVTVHDPLNEALDDCIWTCQGAGGGACGEALPSGSLMGLVELPVGGAVTFAGHCTVTPDAVGQLVNVASLILPNSAVDPNLLDNTASDVANLVPQFNLRVDLSALPETVTAGESIEYGLVVHNDGPSPAQGAALQAVVSDELACTWTCVESAGALCPPEPTTGNLFELVDLQPAAALHYQAICQVDPAAEGPLQASANIEAPPGADDVDPGDNVAVVQTDVQRWADLSITKDDGQDSAQPGDTLTYAIRVHNHGPSQVDTALVEDLFPGVLVCSWSCAPDLGVQCQEGESVGDLQDTLTLPPDLGALYSATCTLDDGATGEVVNHASVTMDGPESTEDPDLSNNVATDTNVVGSDVDLALELTAEPDPVATGNLLLYRAEVENLGPLSDGDVRVTVLLPAATQWLDAFVGDPGLLFRDGFESGDISAWQGSASEGIANPCTLEGNTLDCRLGVLGVENRLDLVVVVEVLAHDGATLVATATVLGAGTDPVSNNNTDTAITQVGTEASPSLPETP